MSKEELVKTCIVPEWMRTDPHEPVTQEQYTQGLLKAVSELCLSKGEIEEIRDGKIERGQLRAYIPYN